MKLSIISFAAYAIGLCLYIETFSPSFNPHKQNFILDEYPEVTGIMLPEVVITATRTDDRANDETMLEYTLPEVTICASPLPGKVRNQICENLSPAHKKRL
jgi:hypothetical protein